MSQKLIEKARKVAEKAYAPYSHFRVGAALETDSGKIFLGVNVENRSFGLTVCAERNAFFAAIAEGEKTFKALAIFCPDAKEPTPPCGACRQVIGEFTSSDFPVFFGWCDKEERVTKTTLGELLPFDSLQNLKNDLG